MNGSGNEIKDFSWNDVQLFLAVVEHKSFSAAARSLGLGQPTISRRIQELEQKLNQALFVRGKFGAEATAQAERLFPIAEQMAKWAIEFEQTAKSDEQMVKGKVTIAAPPGVAVEQLTPFAARLLLQEPEIRLEVLASIEHVDLSQGGADIAIRTQPPKEPGLIAFHTIETQMVVLASKDYAENLTQPCDIKNLDWVTWAGQYKQLAPRPMLERLIPNFIPVFASDDYVAQLAAVKAGIGVNICTRPLGLEQSELVEIDVGMSLPRTKFYIVCAKSMRHVPRVLAIVDRLIQAVSEQPS